MDANIGTNSTETKTRYNKNAPQQVKFKKADDDYSYILVFRIEKLDDDDLGVIDRLSKIKFEAVEDSQKMTIDNLDASEWFFDKNVRLVDGFEGELPQNWQSEFTPLEKQAVVADFLSVEVFKFVKAKTPKKFTFGSGLKPRKVTLKVIFDGSEMLVRHELPNNINTFLSRFRDITGGLESKQGETGTFLPETQTLLAELYDEAKIVFSTDDYADEPPSHHKAAVLRDVFGLQTHSQSKKLRA